MAGKGTLIHQVAPTRMPPFVVPRLKLDASLPMEIIAINMSRFRPQKEPLFYLEQGKCIINPSIPGRLPTANVFAVRKFDQKKDALFN